MAPKNFKLRPDPMQDLVSRLDRLEQNHYADKQSVGCNTTPVSFATETSARTLGGDIRGATAFHMADETAAMLSQLSNRVCCLADRLVGCVPESASKDEVAGPNGVLGQLNMQAREAMRRIAQANEALSRIEAALP